MVYCDGTIFEMARDVSNKQKTCPRSHRIKLICVPSKEKEEEEGKELKVEVEEEEAEETEEEEVEIEEEKRERREKEEEEECSNIIVGQTETLENMLKSGNVIICRSIPPCCESIDHNVNDTIVELPLECRYSKNDLDPTKSRSIDRRRRPRPDVVVVVDRSTRNEQEDDRICSARCRPVKKNDRCSTKINVERRRDVVGHDDDSTRIVECPSFRKKFINEELLIAKGSCSKDSLECYKGYVSADRLEKYRACRSKRNGLQDDCYLPLSPDIKLKIKERCRRDRKEQCLVLG